MFGGAGKVIVIDRGFVTVAGGFPESCSRKVGENVPAVVGCPLITPDELSKSRPGGNEPLLIPHVYGVVPPVPLSANA